MISLSKSQHLAGSGILLQAPVKTQFQYSPAFRHAFKAVLFSFLAIRRVQSTPIAPCYAKIAPIATDTTSQLLAIPSCLNAMCSICANTALCNSLPWKELVHHESDTSSQRRIFRRSRKLPRRACLILLHAFAGSCEADFCAG